MIGDTMESTYERNHNQEPVNSILRNQKARAEQSQVPNQARSSGLSSCAPQQDFPGHNPLKHQSKRVNFSLLLLASLFLFSAIFSALINYLP
jgi:hypothetical protein